MNRSAVIPMVIGLLLGGILVYFVANDGLRRANERIGISSAAPTKPVSPGSAAKRNANRLTEPGMDWLATLGPLLLLVGMGGTAFVESKLHQAMFHNGQLQWDFGRRELCGIIGGCPFFAFVMTAAMLLPIFVCLDRYEVLTLFPTLGWTLAAGGLINGLGVPWLLLRITRWRQPNRLRYAAVAAIWLNGLAMAAHAYFLFVNPDALPGLIGPRTAMAILWAMGLVCLPLLFLTTRHGPEGMLRMYQADWGFVRQRVAIWLWAAIAFAALSVNLMILPAWQFRARLLSMPWWTGYMLLCGPPLLLLVSWFLWHQSRRAAPGNRLIAKLSAILLLAAAIQLFAFPRVRF